MLYGSINLQILYDEVNAADAFDQWAIDGCKGNAIIAKKNNPHVAH